MTKLNNRNDGYILLAIAITKLAAIDYQQAYQKSLKEGCPNEELIELEKWFKSRRGRIISFNLGEVIMERIRNNETVVEDEIDGQEEI